MKIKEFFKSFFTNRKYLSPFIVICVFVFALLLDELTKGLIIPHLIPKVYDHVSVIPKFISFIYVQNRGAAWGILENNTIFLIIMSFVGIAVIMAFYIVRLKKVGNKASILCAVSVGLIIGGAIGNLGDRLFLGYVRDFINFDFMNFPVFNFADVALTFGIVLLVIYILFYYSKEVPEGENAESGIDWKIFKRKKDKNAEKVGKNSEKTVENEENKQLLTEKDMSIEIENEENKDGKTEKITKEIEESTEQSDNESIGGDEA